MERERRKGVQEQMAQLNNSEESSSQQQEQESSTLQDQERSSNPEEFLYQSHHYDREQYYNSNSSDRNSPQPPEYSEKTILKKPSIPFILRSRSPSTSAEADTPKQQEQQDFVEDITGIPIASTSKSARKSSILKKKKQEFHNTNTVSFELDCSPPITRTKSTESNLSCSCESETGYWSCGEVSSSRSSLGSTGGILKTSNNKREDSDNKSILRRSSNPSLNSVDSSSQSELQSILKRKLSYDSSVLLNEATNCPSRNSLTLSTNSLPSSYCCSCSPEPKPILKKKSSSEELDDDYCATNNVMNPKPILKKRSKKTSDREDREVIRPILKKSTSEWYEEDDMKQEKRRGSGGKKGILKRSSLKSSDDDESDFNWVRESSLSVSSPGDFSRFSPTPSSPPLLQERRSSEPITSIRRSKNKHQQHQDQQQSALKSSSTNTMDHRTESEEDILLGLSVAEKRSLFMQLERESMNSKRRTNNNNRFKTQPVTNDEVEAAQLINNSVIDNVIKDCVKVKTQMRKGQLLSSMLGEISDSHSKVTTQTPTSTLTIGSQTNDGKRSSDADDEVLFAADDTRNNKRKEVVINRVDSFSLKDRVRMFNNNSSNNYNNINNNNSSTNGMQKQKQQLPCNKYNYKKRCLDRTLLDENTKKEEDVMDCAAAASTENLPIATVRRQGQVTEQVELHNQKNGVSTANANTDADEITTSSTTSTIINNLVTSTASSSFSVPSSTLSPIEPALSFGEVQGQDENGTQLDNQSIIAQNSDPLNKSQSVEVSKETETKAVQFELAETIVSTTEEINNQEQFKSEIINTNRPTKPASPVVCSSSDEEGVMDSKDKIVSFVKKQLSRSSSCSFSSSNNMEIPYNNNQSEPKSKISETIAALKENGEISWLKRLPPKKNEVITAENDQENVESKNNKNSSNIIKSRLSLLEKSQATWKKRISESDATDFTVEGRLAKAGIKPTIKPPVVNPITTKLVQSKSQTQIATKFSTTNIEIDCAGDSNGELRLNEQRALSKSKTVSKLQHLSSPSDSVEEDTTIKIAVAQNDNETFSQFFPTRKSEMVTVDESSFSSIKTHQLLTGLKKPMKVNRNYGNTKNPVKALASRLTEQSYIDKNPETREKENKKKIQIENLAKTTPHLSIEALAGLASREDFTAVRLKKANTTNVAKEYPFPMLLQVKGKRYVQTRLVKPEAMSLSSGDCFLLITGDDKIYQFVGEFANRMEKSKLSDITNIIVQKKELGCRNVQLMTMEEPVIHAKDYEAFMKVLGGGQKPTDDQLGDEHDESYEIGVTRTNRVYKVEDGVLVPFKNEDAGWGTQPKYSILTDTNVLVFDFGSELYVWSGSKADPGLKKQSTDLAKEMFQANYTVQDEHSPISSGLQRPSWCWFKKINQFMEPVLFREKFFDWPDDELIRKFTRKDESTRGSFDKDPGYNFQPINPDDMRNAYKELEDAGLILEGFNVGRGRSVYDEVDRRLFVIESSNIKTWHVTADSTKVITTSNFYSTETYVIRWQYVVKQTTRDLKGNESRHAAVGRERTAYFFWHGAESSIGDKGTSALMTVELDEEKGPQVRVIQGAEPPAFLSLHSGLWFFNSGSRDMCAKKKQRLFVTMGGKEEEGHLIEVPVDVASFRSKSSFVYLDVVGKCIYVWHGCSSTNVSKKISKNSAYEIRVASDLGNSVKILEVDEGDEPQVFLDSLKIKNVDKWRKSYASFVGCVKEESELQLFRFTSLNGIFEAIPIPSTRKGKDVYDPFPFLQEELYSAQQPALFMITSKNETWLWQGWFPIDNEQENSTTGSLSYRWQAERKAALITAHNFCSSGKIISAGFEPTEFIALFPYWKQSTLELNGDSPMNLSEALNLCTRKTTYTVEELQARPEGVDVLKLETYLSDDDFENLLKMSRADFDKLQSWKKTELKKQAGLF